MDSSWRLGGKRRRLERNRRRLGGNRRRLEGNRRRLEGGQRQFRGAPSCAWAAVADAKRERDRLDVPAERARRALRTAGQPPTSHRRLLAVARNVPSFVWPPSPLASVPQPRVCWRRWWAWRAAPRRGWSSTSSSTSRTGTACVSSCWRPRRCSTCLRYAAPPPGPGASLIGTLPGVRECLCSVFTGRTPVCSGAHALSPAAPRIPPSTGILGTGEVTAIWNGRIRCNNPACQIPTWLSRCRRSWHAHCAPQPPGNESNPSPPEVSNN